MNLKQLTALSTFQKRAQTIITSLIKPLLFLGAVLFSTVIFADIKIAVVDTGFCAAKVKVKSKTHKVFPARDMTGTNKMNCAKITTKELAQSPRYHGQKVLNEFLNFLPKKVVIKVYPLVVYDKKGVQTEKGWRNALEYIEKEKIDMVLTASGFITSEKLVEELPGIWFVPSGRIERMIDSKTALFPQSLAPKPNLFLIGDYFEGTLYDQNLLYQDQIDYYFPSGKKAFKGTSRAVAEAMGRALDKCFIPKDIIAAHSLRLCLLKHEKLLKDRILKKEFKTF